MTKPKYFDIDEFIESLRGTINTIDSNLPEGMEYQDLTSDDFDKIDNEIFECTECNWWCEASELSESDDNICLDCYEND